jgi:hypothetical protein
MTEQQPYEVVREQPGFVMPADSTSTALLTRRTRTAVCGRSRPRRPPR